MLDHIISAILIQSDIREPFDLSNLHRRPGSQKINNKNDIFGFVNTFFLEFRTCFCHKVDKIERKVINKSIEKERSVAPKNECPNLMF